MRKVITLIALLLGSLGAAAQDTISALQQPCLPERTLYRTVSGTLAVGFIDHYRRDYDMPAGFEKGSTSGFAPIYARIEYGIARNVTVGASLIYDAFVYNYNQLYDSHSGTIRRYRTDRFRLFGGGLAGYYHFRGFASIPRLKPFIGAGLSLNNIRHSNLPQGDSTVTTVHHTVSPYLKVGTRYYVSDKFSLYADAGYDRQSYFSVGASCTFFRKQNNVK